MPDPTPIEVKPTNGHVCPYLGREGDPHTYFVQPHRSHRCNAVGPACHISMDEQVHLCYGDHAACPRYLPLDDRGRRATPVPREPATTPGAAGGRAAPPPPGVAQPPHEERRTCATV